ncbi:hypothetical protein ACIHFD_31550 [Nonomuraea sp. NPDC051941]|uniref:hypothetical protein n=1 Tax=Nonomuraea sp. NPDC051941 TaxID=3364373 RepID=UPI0037C8AB8C
MSNGETPQPGWLPRRWLTVVSCDLDLRAGVGAIWLVSLPGSTRAINHTALIERCGQQWRWIGGGSGAADLPTERSAAGSPGQIGMMEIGGESGVVSLVYRLRHPHLDSAPWVQSSELRVATEVDHLLLGERRIEVPAHGALIVVWKSPSNHATRPLIVALNHEGSQLSKIGPHDRVDSFTWTRLNNQ